MSKQEHDSPGQMLQALCMRYGVPRDARKAILSEQTMELYAMLQREKHHAQNLDVMRRIDQSLSSIAQSLKKR